MRLNFVFLRLFLDMLVVVIILFAICWGPNLGFTVYSRFYLDPAERNIQKWRLISSALQILSLMNSAWNPVIYAYLQKITSFPKTMSLQRELFLTMFYTINLSPLLVTK